MKSAPMLVAGVMSGTSADGINVALVQISAGSGAGRILPSPPAFRLLGHAEFSYPKKVRAAILAAMNASQIAVADLSRLNFLLGELYADAVISTASKFKQRIDLVGCHGQTLFHQGESRLFLGRKIVATWQIGEAAIVSARAHVPVISDFRPADMAAGGKGAPLVPFFDYMLFRDAKVGRIAQNIGGIANLSAIPAAAAPGDVIAFDTGPGNMVIDSVTEKLFGQAFDRSGKIAASGKILMPILTSVMRREFFRRPPPKTAGREEFGREFVSEFLVMCKRAKKEDIVATATALTATSIANAVERNLQRNGKFNFSEMIVSGGGVRNVTLISMLKKQLGQLGLRLRSSDEIGLPSEAKEAAAFALLAYETWHRRPSNIPSATGAKRPAVLGKISYP